MLINADFKQLEWLCAVYLSKDEVGYREILDGVDLHSDNQRRFNLPSRTIAKIFLFRLIYGGSAYSYATDAEFAEVGFTEAQWQEVIDKFYLKYQGLKRWHDSLMEGVLQSGSTLIVTGREFEYSRDQKGQLPRTTILNYPVQGLGADLMLLCRILVARSLRQAGLMRKVLMVSTVHDSILLDTPSIYVPQGIQAIRQGWNDAPRFFEQNFGVPFDLPMRVEIKVGMNALDMEEV